jgi:ParB-like chromosome segregation protein Spo0J
MIEQKRYAAVNGIAVDEAIGVDSMGVVERLPEVGVPIASLVPAFHLRASGVDAAHVQLLASAAGSVRLPPILVQKNGTRIIDGMHRIEAARLRGEWSIEARIVDCTDAQALILAIKSNTLHGLPLSKSDRISGAKRILAVHPDWSDRAIAGITGLSAKAIASLRSSSTVPQMHLKRLGRDGKRRPMIRGEGKRRAVEYITAHPEASVRRVARETDVSVGTVQKARESLRSSTPQSSDDRVTDTAADCQLPIERGPRPARRGGTVPHLAWSVVAHKLTSDPVLRYTEGGRAFLDWMRDHSMHADEWREFADAIPSHWLDNVSRIALGMSDEWGQFAECVKLRQR